MSIYVRKKDGSLEDINDNKIFLAIGKAMTACNSYDEDECSEITDIVLDNILHNKNEAIHVNEIHTLVENTLMYLDAFDIAREYISYRAMNKPDIFRERKNILPYEYPEILQYVDAIRQSHWLHTEYDYDQDVRDYKNPKLPQHYRTVYARCLLAISQIEVVVKSYWKNVDNLFPKHEFSMLAGTFDESEARHFDTYRNLLELVDLNEMFNRLDESAALSARSKSLQDVIRVPGQSKKDILLKNIMFSSFIENVSLYSQFLILKAFAEKMSLFKGTANGVDATSTEEITHFLAGVSISNIVIRENPKMLSEDMKNEIISRANKGIQEEFALIEWLFDGKDLPFITRNQVKQFITVRMYDSLAKLNIEFLDKDIIDDYRKQLAEFEWFADKEKMLMQTDFFAGRETNYTKGTRTFSSTSLYNDEFKEIMGDLNVPMAG